MKKKSIYEIYDYLPQTNCGECGMTCMKFAGFLLARDVKLDACPPLSLPEFKEKKEELAKLIGTGEKNELTGLIVDNSKCIGCGICENKCPVSPKAAVLVTGQIPGKKSHGGLIEAEKESRMESSSPQSIDKVKPLGQE